MALRSAKNEADVFIVGAGPSGLVAGLQLAACGVSFRIVDRKETFSENSRAVGIQPRSLELFEQMGIVDDFLAKGRRASGVDLHTRGRVIEIDLFTQGQRETGYPFLLLLEQNETEKILHRHLQARGNEIEWDSEVVGVDQYEDGVVVRMRKAKGEETVRARWLIAADGAKSVVRHAIGMPFVGSTYEQKYAVVDVKTIEGRVDQNRLNLNFNETGAILLLPMARAGVYRLVTNFPPSFEHGEKEPGFEDIEQHVARVFPGGLRIAEPTWYSNFRIHSRSVSRFQRGSVFFVGDAAHIHSPVGAQGMNTGVQDAYNLAWKLALVVKGVLPQGVLDSYHQERYPVAQRLLRTTDRVFRLVARQNVLLKVFRIYFYPHLIKLLTGVPGVRSEVFRAISQIGIRYREGFLISEDGRGFPHSAPRPGERLPYVYFIRDARRLSSYTLFDYRRHHLLMFVKEEEVALAGNTRAAMEKEFAGVVDAHVVALQNEAPRALRDHLLLCDAETFRVFRVKEVTSYLVRPDTYLALRERSVAAGTLLKALRGYFQR